MKVKIILVILVIFVAAVIGAMKFHRAGVERDAAQPGEREFRSAEYNSFQAECERGRTTEQQFAASIKSGDGKYRRTDKAAFEQVLAEVRPGMDEEKIMRIAGKPSYVHATWHNDTEILCYWEYVLSGHRRGGDFIVDENADIAFDKNHHAVTAAETWQRIDPSSVR